MTDSALAKKLQIKPGQRMAVLNSPDGYLDKLPEGTEVLEKQEGTFDFVQLFVKNLAELNSLLSTATGAVKRDGLLWISYPKQSPKLKTDVNRDILRELVSQTGWQGISMIAIDTVWSAMRCRPTELVGKK